MKIYLFNTRKKYISKKSVQDCIENFAKKEKVIFDEIGIHFVGKKKISALHKQFFNDPSLTDCITFPIYNKKGDGYSFGGDIFICPEVAYEYAKLHGIDPKCEVWLYLIHGLLHLVGYDDIDPKSRQKMRRKERQHLPKNCSF